MIKSLLSASCAGDDPSNSTRHNSIHDIHNGIDSLPPDVKNILSGLHSTTAFVTSAQGSSPFNNSTLIQSNQATHSPSPIPSSSSSLNEKESDSKCKSPQPDANMAAMLAALNGSYGMPSMMLDNPVSRLLMSNNGSDLMSYSALCGIDPSTLAGALSSLSGIQGNVPGLAKSLPGSSKSHEDKEADASLNNVTDTLPGINNVAALSFLLQQQSQVPSIGINSNSTNNGFSGLAGLASLPGMPSSLIPESLMPLEHVLKKMKYNEFVPMKRKPRSSNHTKSFHCSLCSKRFSMKDELEEHMLTHTSDELGNESYMQKSFACSECSFRTKYKFCLQRHMHIHSGEKPLMCPYCRYRSISKVSYDNHIRTHTGEKPFACPYCSYKSSFKNNLTKHIKTHTGTSKPYTCNKCNSCFSSQMQLKAHMRLHLDPTGTHNCTYCLYTCLSQFELDCHMRTHVMA